MKNWPKHAITGLLTTTWLLSLAIIAAIFTNDKNK